MTYNQQGKLFKIDGSRKMGDDTKFTAEQFLLICQKCFDPADDMRLIEFLQGDGSYEKLRKKPEYKDLQLTEEQFGALQKMAGTANFGALKTVVGVVECEKAVI
jgi:hypothetical protein